MCLFLAPGKRIRPFRFLVPVRFLGHPARSNYRALRTCSTLAFRCHSSHAHNTPDKQTLLTYNIYQNTQCHVSFMQESHVSRVFPWNCASFLEIWESWNRCQIKKLILGELLSSCCIVGGMWSRTSPSKLCVKLLPAHAWWKRGLCQRHAGGCMRYLGPSQRPALRGALGASDSWCNGVQNSGVRGTPELKKRLWPLENRSSCGFGTLPELYSHLKTPLV